MGSALPWSFFDGAFKSILPIASNLMEEILNKTGSDSALKEFSFPFEVVVVIR
jgi:hypothetical protein